MLRFIIRRLFYMLFVLAIVSMITFVLMRAVPGGPFNTERGTPRPVQEALERRFGLDRPLPEQYLIYISNIIVPRITGPEFRRSLTDDYIVNIPLPFLGEDATLRWMNFGPSLKTRSRTVNQIFIENLPNSIQLGVAALAVGMSIGIPAGIIAALRRNTAWDYAGMGIAIVGVSVPVIISGPILQYLFGVQFGILPPSGWGSIEFVILPAFALGFTESAILARLTRASLLQVLGEDFIRTARAKGLDPAQVLRRHALGNALIPVITILGLQFSFLVAGTIVVENVFALPGLGRLLVQAVGGHDLILIKSLVLLFVGTVIAVNTMVDLAYGLIDPRLRVSA